MAASFSSSIFDTPNIIIVPVIASFSSGGEVKPLYVRLNGISYKIYSSSPMHAARSKLKYRCEIVDNNIVKFIELTYHLYECAWSISTVYS